LNVRKSDSIRCGPFLMLSYEIMSEIVQNSHVRDKIPRFSCDCFSYRERTIFYAASKRKNPLIRPLADAKASLFQEDSPALGPIGTRRRYPFPAENDIVGVKVDVHLSALSLLKTIPCRAPE